MAFSNTAKRVIQSPASTFFTYAPTVCKGAAFGMLATMADTTRNVYQQAGHSEAAMLLNIASYLFAAFPIGETLVPVLKRESSTMTRQDWKNFGTAGVSTVVGATVLPRLIMHYMAIPK